ncbi:GDP-mannose 4,6-dehydratase [Candidatus Pelagibacter sp.]|jgi:GDP-4-dehydro-6-deoxy-D-mannose reductase|nr:GDP-mannose 4,6-dehydratase [Candidatus Pelagibacter sp.]
MNRVFKKCLITGIGGSGGSYLAEHILKKSPSTKIFGFRRSEGYSSFLKKKYKSKVIITKIDLNNFNNLKKKLSIIKPDVIFHLASNADVRNSFFEPLKFSENNNMITVNLLEALKQLKSKAIIIICSTSEVYGNVEKKNMPIKETQQIAPINPYAVTKVFQDLMSQVYEKTFDMNVIITRMFSYMNPRRNNLFQTAFANQIAAIEQGKLKYLRHGNLKSKRTIIDTKDAMEAYWLAAKKGKIGEIYNICGNQQISVNNFLKKLISFSDKKIICKLDKNLVRPKDIDLQISDSKKFQKDTGWRPQTNLNLAILNLLNECRKNKFF